MSIAARRLAAVVVVLLVAGACASASEDESIDPTSAAPSRSTTIDARGAFSIGPGGDGTLDCSEPSGRD